MNIPITPNILVDFFRLKSFEWHDYWIFYNQVAFVSRASLVSEDSGRILVYYINEKEIEIILHHNPKELPERVYDHVCQVFYKGKWIGRYEYTCLAEDESHKYYNQLATELKSLIKQHKENDKKLIEEYLNAMSNM